MKTIAPVLAALFALSVFNTAAADWPRWRGPTLNGISTEKGWNANWATPPKVLWRANVGLGYSSFAVAGGRVYTQGNSGNQDTIFCFDAATGKEIWKHSYAEDKGARYHQGGTNTTPAVDGGAVYTVSKSGWAYCLDAATGKEKWKVNVLRAIGAKMPEWGLGSSPLVLGKLVILNAGATGTALNKDTGAVVWKSAGNKKAGYASAVPYRTGNSWGVAIFSGTEAVGVNASNGQVFWRYPWKTKYDVNSADLIISGQTIFLTSGYNRGCTLLRFTGSGLKPVYENKALRAQQNSPVLIGGHLYGIDGDARRFTLKCVELATGKVKWKGDNIAALMAADGKLICQGETGQLYLVAADPAGYKKLAETSVFREPSWSTPVLANGRIYTRGHRGTVVCVDVSGK